MYNERSRPFVLYVSIDYCTVLVNSIPIMAHQNGKSRTMRLRNTKRISADKRTNRKNRAATNNNNTDVVESKNNNGNITGENNVNNADEAAEEDEDNDVTLEEIDRSMTVTVSVLGKTFLTPDEHYYVTFTDYSYLHEIRHWFDGYVVLIDCLLKEFCSEQKLETRWYFARCGADSIMGGPILLS